MKNDWNKKQEPVQLPLGRLHRFPGHPYKVEDNEEMEALTESIREYGILNPLLVRRVDGSETDYELISGHRRAYAAAKAGLETVPAFVVSLDRNAAAIALVDSNLHREHILPSEKAFAYRSPGGGGCGGAEAGPPASGLQGSDRRADGPPGQRRSPL